MSPAVQAHLAALGIRVSAETPSYYLLTRDDQIVLLDHATHIPGSTGMLTSNGLAYLIWRDGQAYLKSKTAEIPATDDQVAAIRRFSQDIQSALSQPPDMLT